MTDHGLGRRPLPEGETKHLEKYPLRMPTTVTQVEQFLPLPYSYRPKYDQGSEGACVGFALSWAMSILNRRFYSAMDLYRQAQRQDEWPGESYSGTSVRAGCDVLRERGHKLLHRHNHVHDWDPAHGIQRNEWASSVDDIRTCIANGVPVVLGIDWMSNFNRPILKGREYWIGEGDLGQVLGGHAICAYAASDRRQAIKLVNSWGTDYPYVWLPYDTLQRLLNGIKWPGEATVIVDR